MGHDSQARPVGRHGKTWEALLVGILVGMGGVTGKKLHLVFMASMVDQPLQLTTDDHTRQISVVIVGD